MEDTEKGQESERRAFSVAEVAGSLAVSPQFIRLEIGRGKLRSLRLGRRVLVEADEWEAYLACARGES